jgi:hypothetical protein
VTSTCQLSPAFHHEFTIKKPRSATRFSQNPQQKRPNLSTEKNTKNTQPARANLGVIRFSKIGKQKALTARRRGPPLRFHGNKYGVNLLKGRGIV